MAIKLIIDSASDINEKEAKQLGVTMIPIVIRLGEEEFYDGVDLLPKTFYEKLINSKELPKTSQISPYRFEEVFEQATKNGDKVLAIVLSSKLSGTYESAKSAASKFKGNVYVVDSLSASVGERLLLLYAIELVKKGKDIKEIYEELEKKKHSICIMAVLETLEYLKKGGRISSAVAFLGGMLKIKPVVHLIDGEIKMAGKSIGQRKGAELMNSLIKNSGEIDFSMPYGVLWTGLDESVATNYIVNNQELWGESQKPTAYIVGSTIGTHVGPGVFGLAYFKK